MSDINSHEYWNQRFASNWEARMGRNQTEYFAKTALNHLPHWLIMSIRDSGLSICDAGCAEGDAVPLLQGLFPQSRVVGIDFSEEATQKAVAYYPHHTFEVGDITQLAAEYDVVFCSNVLEHFSDPFGAAKAILAKTRRYFIMMVPFEEYERAEEHFYTFEKQTFPESLAGFTVGYYEVIDCAKDEGTYWNGKQALVVYVKQGEEEEEMDISTLRNLKDTKEKLEAKVQDLSVKYEALQEEAKNKGDLYEAALRVLEQEKEEIDHRRNQFEYLYNDLMQQYKKMEAQFSQMNAELYRVKQSKVWKMGSQYHKLKQKTKVHYVSRAIRVAQRDGIRTLARMVKQKMKRDVRQVTHHEWYKKELKAILKKHPRVPVIVLPTLIDWNVPLFQRPQHIAKNMAEQGYLYFYGSCNRYDKVDGFEQVGDHCFVTNLSEDTMMELLQEEKRQKILHLYSTDNTRGYEYAEKAQKLGFQVLYEYVDEMSEDISGQTISEDIYQKHRRILEDERMYVVSTADKLHQEVLKARTKNCLLATNGVQLEHFTQTGLDTPEDIKALVAKGKPIIGYFGAFAKWFDYPLVEKMAEAHPDWELLLIGSDYDGSIQSSNLSKYDNVHVIGPIQYPDLPRYAQHFTVSTIPFLINDITESTSPVKLFEYMAMKKAIVTTGMPECRKYQSVLIGETHDHFIAQVEAALEKNHDPQYLELLETEAAQNTWKQKAADMIRLLSNPC